MGVLWLGLWVDLAVTRGSPAEGRPSTLVLSVEGPGL